MVALDHPELLLPPFLALTFPHMDLAERLSNLQARSKLTGGYTDKQAKTKFLELLSQGVTPKKAAEHTGRTGTWFRARRNPDASNYDQEFAVAYEQAMGDHRSAAASDALQGLYDECQKGNVRACEKILAAYHEDFGFMRNQTAQGGLNIEQLQVFFGELSLEKLMELKQARETTRMKELPVIDL